MREPTVSLRQVKEFWETHPLLSYELKSEPGSPEFFAEFDAIKAEVEKYNLHLFQFELYRSKDVLDVGCGNGWLLSRYAMAGASVTGIDLTAKGIEVSRKRFSLAGLTGTFTVGNAEELPFPDGSFDLVSSIGVIHHTPNTARCVDQIYRVIRPGGRVVCAVYYENLALKRELFPLARLAMRLAGLKGYAALTRQQLINRFDGAHNPLGKAYSESQVREMFRAFAGVRTEVHYFPTRLLLGAKRIPQWLEAFLDGHLGFLIYVTGMK